LSVINFAPSVLFCIILLLNEHHWNYKSKTANYVEKRMMLKQFYWKCIIWPEHCHEATRMIIWPEIVMTPAGWSYDLNIVMNPPAMITWPEHCHEAAGMITWPEHCHEASEMIIWPAHYHDVAGVIIWPAHCHEVTCGWSCVY
jgi:hypothetical protein